MAWTCGTTTLFQATDLLDWSCDRLIGSQLCYQVGQRNFKDRYPWFISTSIFLCFYVFCKPNMKNGQLDLTCGSPFENPCPMLLNGTLNFIAHLMNECNLQDTLMPSLFHDVSFYFPCRFVDKIKSSIRYLLLHCQVIQHCFCEFSLL